MRKKNKTISKTNYVLIKRRNLIIKNTTIRKAVDIQQNIKD